MLNKLSKIILDHPKFVLAAILSLTMGFGYMAFLSPYHLRIDFSLEQMFPNDDPEREVYEKFREEFTREDDIILLTYAGIPILEKTSVEALGDLTEELEFIEGVEQVLSLSNLQDGNYFDIEMEGREWEARAVDVLNHPIYTNLIISKKGDVGSILINLSDDVKDQEARARVFNEIDNIKSQYKWEWHEAGIPVLRTRYVELVDRERTIFFPISFAVVTLILFFVFRQKRGVLLPLAAISVGLIWISGLMAVLGITINVVSFLTFNLLMIIGCSNAIHLMIKYHEGLSLGLGRRGSLDRVITEIGGALFLTSFTTSVGFFSLMMTNIRITQEFGFIVGVGVILMFILTIIILPIILSFLPLPKEKNIKRLVEGEEFKAAENLNEWSRSHPRSILFITSIIFILSIVGLYKVNYNISILDDLKPGNQLYDSIHYVETHMGGTLPLEVVVDTKIENGIADPKFLSKIDLFKNFLLSQEGVGGAITVSDHIKLVNEEIGSGFRELPSQSIEVLSLVETYDEISGLVNDDLSKTRISARVKNINSETAEHIVRELKAESARLFGDDVDVIITGSTLLALHTSKHLVKNLTTSFMLAFIIIFISMVFLFKSVRLSILSVLPTIIPLMAAGGIMGFMGIKLRPSTAMTFSIALGIAVDDTIHFLARFRQEYMQSQDVPAAVTKTLLTTGKAIISTTIILSLGFVVMVFSEFVPNHEFGILATIVLLIALAGSMVLLPVLINYLNPKFRFSLDFKSKNDNR
ncbi:MAG: MMPL family transporter [Candidatus Marinimicrobia bacterium]|nr:MMPL family transporter [Candidatus Neomarinimicrobiota bacterium]